MPRHLLTSALCLPLLLASTAHAASVTLYDQDFENPQGFVNGFGSGYSDLSQQQVNDLYVNQPFGFEFAQSFTVETVLLTGTQAFGTGYVDPTGQGEDYALGMLATAQDDRLGLSFDAGAFDFFNFRFDFSSLGLHSGPGAPFADPNVVPQFALSVYDNPTGVRTIGGGTLLDSVVVSGTASALDTLDWTTSTTAFDISGATNGNVTLQLDLLTAGYAAFDNFLITASDEAGGGIPTTPPAVPLPATLPLLLLGLGAVRLARGRR